MVVSTVSKALTKSPPILVTAYHLLLSSKKRHKEKTELLQTVTNTVNHNVQFIQNGIGLKLPVVGAVLTNNTEHTSKTEHKKHLTLNLFSDHDLPIGSLHLITPLGNDGLYEVTVGKSPTATAIEAFISRRSKA